MICLHLERFCSLSVKSGYYLKPLRLLSLCERALHQRIAPDCCRQYEQSTSSQAVCDGDSDHYSLRCGCQLPSHDANCLHKAAKMIDGQPQFCSQRTLMIDPFAAFYAQNAVAGLNYSWEGGTAGRNYSLEGNRDFVWHFLLL